MKNMTLAKLVLLIAVPLSLTSHAETRTFGKTRYQVDEELVYAVKKCEILTAQKFPGRSYILKSCNAEAIQARISYLSQKGALEFDKATATDQELSEFRSIDLNASLVYQRTLAACYARNQVNPRIFLPLQGYKSECIKAVLD